MVPVTAIARPRVGLLGNPSDGYGGSVISFTFDDAAARTTITPESDCVLIGPDSFQFRAKDHRELTSIEPTQATGSAALLLATCRRHAARHLQTREAWRSSTFRLTSTTDIPRQVGLSGSSALILATWRALDAWFGVATDPMEMAYGALAVETEDLGIAAGPQDRVVQSHEGLLAMEFRPPITKASFQRLDPSRLPTLYLSFHPKDGESSGRVHRNLQRRHHQGDPEVIAIMNEIASIARDARRDWDVLTAPILGEWMDRNRVLRERLVPLSPSDSTLVSIAQRHGAPSKLCGSGGAIVGIAETADVAGKLAAAHRSVGACFLLPTVTIPRTAS